VVLPDAESALGLEPFEEVILGENDTVTSVYVGVEDAFVNKEDFYAWKKAVKAWMSEEYKKQGKSKAKTVPKLDSSLLEWAVGMIWPDQSYVSMRQFRPKGSSGGGWCEFHESRFKVLVGE
jgi:hypothetical protein